MGLQIEFSEAINSFTAFSNLQTQEQALQEFLKTINDPAVGFFHLGEDGKPLEECRRIYESFSDRSTFVHVGIGGSALGPEMLVHAFPPSPKRKFIFINNIDPCLFQDHLEALDPKKTLFYFVSKSGKTSETLAALSIIGQWLQDRHGIAPGEFKNHMVFATDPDQGDLVQLKNELGIPCLVIPKNVGGRFSVLTPVGLLPALFAGISAQGLLEGAKKIRPMLTSPDMHANLALQTASFLAFLKSERKVNQTVLMPYSSRLKDFSSWFVQLWAESLGKKNDKKGMPVHEGLTPLASLGATDQHSQLQLFMEGPADKCLIFIDVEGHATDYPLKNPFSTASLKKLAPFSLNELFRAFLEGTIQGLADAKRPYMRLRLSKVDEENLGSLILFFESLTVLMGHYLNIDPFDQPGVEASKKFAYQWLEKLQG